MKRLTILALAGLLLAVPLAAQETASEVPPTSVYVTTQDYVSLRQGPGASFNRLAVVPAAVTLPAYGRTSDTRWIQVLYNGARGWIAARYLVWSGDVIELPVDGVNPYPFIRRAAALGVTTRDTPIYPGFIVPGTEVGTIPTGTEVELTGRLGGQGFFQFQVRWQGSLYWVGNWNIRITEGNFQRLLDLTYLYPYGRLLGKLQNDVALSIGSYRQIDGVWARLASGQSVACAPIPPRVTRTLTNEDVGREALFGPAVVALDYAIADINATISAFEDVCSNPAATLTIDLINTQRTALADAGRNLILAGSLLDPLQARNPQIDTTTSRWTGGY